MIAALPRLLYAMLTEPTLQYELEPGGPLFGLPKTSVMPAAPRFMGHERAPNPLVLFSAGISSASPGAGDRLAPLRIVVEAATIGAATAIAEAVRTRLVESSDPYDRPYPAWAYREGIVAVAIGEPAVTDPAFDSTTQRYFLVLTFVLIATQNGCPSVPKSLSALGA